MLRLLTLSLALLATSASAQTQFASLASPAASPDAPSLSAYAGLYATDGGMIEVRDGGDRLVVVAHGAPVAARLAALSATSPVADARTETLLDDWVAGDLTSIVAAVRPARQSHAAESFERYRAALVRGHGDVVAASVVGTFRQIDGRDATLVQILFEHGSEWASFVWAEDGTLVTITRGLSPVAVGTLWSTEADAFAGTDTDVRFEREADGQIGAIRVNDRFVAVR